MDKERGKDYFKKNIVLWLLMLFCLITLVMPGTLVTHANYASHTTLVTPTIHTFFILFMPVTLVLSVCLS